MIDEILNIRHVRKSFSYGIALDDINLDVVRGEVMGIIGENGSGKSVLIRIIAGELKKDQGDLFFEDRRFEPGDILEAQKGGIYRISHKSMLLDDMTVAENLTCVQHFSKIIFMTKRKMNAIARNHLEQFGLKISPGTLVGELSLIQKKQVELLKVILKKPKLLILDEIFSSLGVEYRSWFAEQINAAKQKGTAVLIVSQNLDLVMDLCDRIAIMQDSQIVQIVAGDDIYLSSLFAMLRRGDDMLQQEESLLTGKKVLTVERLRTRKCAEATFSLYEGEVLGIYINDTLVTDGLIGALCGQEKPMGGEINVWGKRMKKFSPERLADHGICVILGEELNQMLLYKDTGLDNIAFFSMKKAAHHGTRNLTMEKLAAAELAAECGLTEEELHMDVACLSAGARQKLAFANSIAIGTRIYILDNIMSHVDFQSQKILYNKMSELKREGASFLFIAKEFEELRIISDRIIYVLDQQISDKWFY